VPRIFDVTYKNFSDVANHYRTESSFKSLMQRLDKSSRDIADRHLHIQIRRREDLPNATQVNFANELDSLLSEIIRILHQ